MNAGLARRAIHAPALTHPTDLSVALPEPSNARHSGHLSGLPCPRCHPRQYAAHMARHSSKYPGTALELVDGSLTGARKAVRRG